MSYVWSTAAVAAAILSGRLFSALAPLPNISMVFLMAVLFSAVSFGMRPAIYASVLSFLSYNFFFIDPLYTFQVTQPHELLALFIFLIVATVTSALAGRVRDQARAANERARTMRRLYEFTWKLSGLSDAGATADGAAGEIHTSLRRPAVILVSQEGELSLSAAWPPEDTLDSLTMEAARLSFARDEPVGCGSKTLPDAQWYFVPLRIQRRSLGVVGIARDERGLPPDSEARALLAALAEQTAAALERSFLMQEMVIARNTAEIERVRNILLASVSHDFRTPLASILGSATSLLEYRDRLEDNIQLGLLADIKAEAEGLDEMVRNLLAIARIDAGALELRRDWVDLREIAERVVSVAKRRGATLSFVLDLPPELPMIAADAILIEQAMVNVVNNAVSHTPAGTRVLIDAVVAPESISLRVTDNGPGIPAEDLHRVFEKFVRAGASKVFGADKGEGTGLGLAITKGIVAAHGGWVRAESPVGKGGGTRITLTFPRKEP
jgi:two-component system, OmpR family, sensor histidine kinase KdpD